MQGIFGGLCVFVFLTNRHKYKIVGTDLEKVVTTPSDDSYSAGANGDEVIDEDSDIDKNK